MHFPTQTVTKRVPFLAYEVFRYFLLALLLGAAPCLAQEAGVASDSTLGFEKLYLSKNRKTDQWGVTVHAVGKSRCMFGDLDVISADLKRSELGAILQLSFETLGVNPGSVMYPETTVKSPNKGGVRTFSVGLPTFEKPTVIGVYLCLTSGKEGGEIEPCSKKALMPFSEMMKPHQIDKDKAIGPDGILQPAPYIETKKYISQEKIYFFRFLIAVKDHLLVPSSPMNAKSYPALKSYLISIGADVADYEALLKRIREYGEKIGSMPLRVKGKELVITLPFYDDKKCSG